MANQIVQLKDGSNNLYPNPNLIGPNHSNILSYEHLCPRAGAAPINRTFNQDCFLFIGFTLRNDNSDSQIYIAIDDNPLELGSSVRDSSSGDWMYKESTTLLIPIKKGQVLSVALADSGQSFVVSIVSVGLKYI